VTRGATTLGKRICSGIGALGFLVGEVFGQGVLRWQFTPGETLAYAITQRTTNSAGPGSTGLTTSLVVNLHYKVEAVDSRGTATLTQTIDRVRVRLESAQGGGSEYDTASAAEPQGVAKWMAPMMQVVVGKPVTLKMSPQGRPSDLKMPKDLLEKIRKAVGGDQLGQFFSAEGIGQVLGPAVLPEQPLQPGHRWPHTATLANPVLGNQTVESVFIYDGMESRGGRPLDRITSSVRTSFTPAAEQALVVEVRQEQARGTIYFDRAAGRLAESHFQSTMKLQVTFARKKLNREMKLDGFFGGKTFHQDVELTRQVQLVPSPP